jgi:hypothetical protein
MRMMTGKVVEGKVVFENEYGEPLEEGITVTILAPENGTVVHLGPEEHAELLEAVAEADATDPADFVDGEQVLRRLWGRD